MRTLVLVQAAMAGKGSDGGRLTTSPASKLALARMPCLASRLAVLSDIRKPVSSRVALTRKTRTWPNAKKRADSIVESSRPKYETTLSPTAAQKPPPLGPFDKPL